MSATKPILLALFEFLPRPDRATGDWHLRNVLQSFARPYEVRCLVRRWDQAVYEGRRDQYVRGFEEMGFSVARLTRAALGRALREPGLGAVMACNGFVPFTHALAVRRARRDVAFLYFALDAMHVAWSRRAEVSDDPRFKRHLLDMAEVWRERQRRTAEIADATIFVSAEEAQVFRDDLPDALIASLPVVVPTRESDPARRLPDTILFACYMQYQANVDGLIHFLGGAYPRIAERVPGVVLNVVGGEPPPALRSAAAGMPGVRFLGFVPDIRVALDEARVSIAPLTWGGGIKGKVVEAMAGGLPVVATSVGAEGMRVRGGEELLIADEPEAFADAVVRLLRDDALHARIAAQGRRYVAENLSLAVLDRGVDALLAELGRRAPKPIPAPLRAWLRRDTPAMTLAARNWKHDEVLEYVQSMGRGGERFRTLWPMLLAAAAANPHRVQANRRALAWMLRRTMTDAATLLRARPGGTAARQ